MLRDVTRCIRHSALIACLLFPVAGDAAADWTFLISAEGADWYIDRAQTRKRGTMAKVWTLQDYATAQPYRTASYLSSKTQFEIRCHSSQFRVFYFASYSGPMGEGKQLYVQEAAGAWKAVSAGNHSQALYRAGCEPDAG